MKRTVAGVVMLAGLGGGCTSTGPLPGVADGAKPFNHVSRTPTADPVVAAGQMPGEKQVKRADYKGSPGSMSGARQESGFSRVSGSMPAGGGGGGMPAGGPTTNRFREAIGHGAGVVPVPAMGPWGATAYVPAGGPGSGMYGGLYANGRTSIRFANPAGMKIGWQTAPGAFSDSGLEAPARFNFAQANTYRLRLSGIPTRPGKQFYPTLEVYPATLQTVTYLSHSTVPVAFTDDDFEQVANGNLVTKVVYLPSERTQLLAGAPGVEEIVSTRLDVGVDPVAEANRLGTILAVIRIGNIDLQDPNTPAPDAPFMGGVPLPPGGVPVPSAPPAPGALPPTINAPGATRVPAIKPVGLSSFSK